MDPAPAPPTSSHRVSLDQVEDAARVIDPVFLRTPQFVCEPLSAELGVRLALKVETLNPLRSFKGRGADLLVAGARPGEPLVCASAGNFGQAMAYACRRRGDDGQAGLLRPTRADAPGAPHGARRLREHPPVARSRPPRGPAAGGERAEPLPATEGQAVKRFSGV